MRTDGGVIANFDMANNANLPAIRTRSPMRVPAGNSGLRCNNGIFTDYDVVRDLHEIVDLYAFLNPGPAKTGPVDGRVRADLDIVVDLNNAELLNLLLSAIDHFKTKTVRTDDCAAVNDYA